VRGRGGLGARGRWRDGEGGPEIGLGGELGEFVGLGGGEFLGHLQPEKEGRPYAKVTEITRVKGIGKGTLAAIQDFLTVE